MQKNAENTQIITVLETNADLLRNESNQKGKLLLELNDNLNQLKVE